MASLQALVLGDRRASALLPAGSGTLQVIGASPRVGRKQLLREGKILTPVPTLRRSWESIWRFWNEGARLTGEYGPQPGWEPALHDPGTPGAPGWSLASGRRDSPPPPPPIGPWATPGDGWPGNAPTWPPPSSPPRAPWPGPPYVPSGAPRRPRGRWTIPFLVLYAVLQGARLGLATAHDSVATTIGVDAGLTALVLILAAVAGYGARRRARRQSDIPIPEPAVVPRRSVTIGWIAGLVALTLVSSLISRSLSVTHRPRIAGAPGYSTYRGPHGYPLAEGRPWGNPCQPLRFSVASDISTADYDQIVAVVESARSDGIDVTIENRNFMWYPSQLYPPGQNNTTVERIGIFASSAAPPRLSDGHLERIGFGWDAAMSRDGHHEHLTDLQATLYLTQLEGHPDRLRIAIRQFIAFTQGVGGSTARDSGISRGTSVDKFRSADLRAMELMSGCDYQTAPSAPPVPAGI